MKFNLSRVFLLGLALTATASLNPVQAQLVNQSKVGRAATFSCKDSEAVIRSKGVVSVQNGTRSIYVGYQQVSKINKNPILARFDGGKLVWCQTNLETTNDDSTGYGLSWDGKDNLFAVFSSTGTQGTPAQDFRRFAVNGWMKDYGVGGGAKAAIIARVNPNTGMPNAATFISSVLPNSKTNSVGVTALDWNGVRLKVSDDAYSYPRNVLRKAMVCAAGSPYKQVIEFSGTLNVALSSKADRCQ